MSEEIERPNASDSTGTVTVTGAGDIHSALSDDSEGSYISPDIGALANVEFSDPTIPAGAVVKEQRFRVKAAKTSATASPNLRMTVAGEVVNAQVFWMVPVEWDIGLSLTGLDPDDTEMGLARTGGSSALRIYELFLDVVYVEQPSVDLVYQPSGTVNENVIEARWGRSHDSAGGVPTHYQVVVVADGDTPGVDDAILDSGIVASSATTHAFATVLPEASYEIGVRVAQTVNGELHWSDYEVEGFTVDVDNPGDPDVVVTPQSAQHRIRIDISDTAGAAATASYEVEHSINGGEYEAIRAYDLTGTDVTAYDLEVPNGADVTYRVRALSADGVASAWVTSAATSWSSDEWSLKHPFDPSLSIIGQRMRSLQSRTREMRKTEHHPLGRTDVVTTSDTPGPRRGELVVRCDDADERAALDALIDTNAPLLLQGPPGAQDADRWISVTAQTSDRVIGQSWDTKTWESMPYTEVARPTGDLVAWPTAGAFDESFSALLEDYADLEFLFVPEAS